MHKPGSAWRAIETLHSGVYFAADGAARFEAVGLRGWWMSYFASRSAALGTPPPEVVVATFHGFAPRLVEKLISIVTKFRPRTARDYSRGIAWPESAKRR